MAFTGRCYLVFFFLSLAQLYISSGQNAVRAGYWSVESGIEASDIDSTLFTHLFCAFAVVDPQSGQVTATDAAQFSNFTSTVQQKNPSVTTLLSIGRGNSAISSTASQAGSRKNFIDSSIKLARSYGFHGLDLDWEHQTMSSEMDNLALLLDEWRTALDDEANSSGSERLILTAAVAYTPQVNPTFPVSTIARTLDWVNSMAYDLYAPKGSKVTRPHAALFNPSTGVGASNGVQAWVDAGLPKKKIVLGFPFYGYAWKLVDPADHGLLAPADGIDKSVGSIDDDGQITYSKIIDFVNEKNAVKVFNSTYVTNYCYSGTSWIGYDDTETISRKASYAKTNGLLGYFAWNVADDDYWVLSRQAMQGWGGA